MTEINYFFNTLRKSNLCQYFIIFFINYRKVKMHLLLILIMSLNSQIQGSTIEEGIALYEKRGEVRDELIPDATNINNVSKHVYTIVLTMSTIFLIGTLFLKASV